jgi:hypothetical protein
MSRNLMEVEAVDDPRNQQVETIAGDGPPRAYSATYWVQAVSNMAVNDEVLCHLFQMPSVP